MKAPPPSSSRSLSATHIHRHFFATSNTVPISAFQASFVCPMCPSILLLFRVGFCGFSSLLVAFWIPFCVSSCVPFLLHLAFLGLYPSGFCVSCFFGSCRALFFSTFGAFRVVLNYPFAFWNVPNCPCFLRRAPPTFPVLLFGSCPSAFFAHCPLCSLVQALPFSAIWGVSLSLI